MVDAETGAHVPGAFGDGIDYVEITAAEDTGRIEDIDDIAIDRDGTMYAIANASGKNDRLVIIDPSTGTATEVGETVVQDIEGLGFDTEGRLWATSGTANELYELCELDTRTGKPIQALPIDNGGDYEGIACVLLVEDEPAIDEDWTVAGGGCSATSSGSGTAAAFLLIVLCIELWRRRRSLQRRGVACMAVVLVLGSAATTNALVNADSVEEPFPISDDGKGLLDVEWGSAQAPRPWELGVADDPLVVVRQMPQGDERIGP